MSSTKLAEYFIPSVKSLAQHISAALDLAEGHARRDRAEAELRRYRDHLEELVRERTAELRIANEQPQEKCAKCSQVEENCRRAKRRTRELKIAQDELVQKEKLAVLGRLAGRVAHELRNPLGVISNSAHYLESQLKEMDGKLREHLDLIREEIQRSDEIIKELLDFSRVRPPARQTGDVNAILNGVLHHGKSPQAIAVQTSLDENLPQIYLDPLQMKTDKLPLKKERNHA